MVRRAVWAVIAVMVVSSPLAVAARTPSPAVALQTEQPPLPPTVDVFPLGEVFTGPGFDVIVGEAFTAPSRDTPGFTEIRAGLVIVNTAADAGGYTDAIFSNPAYPDFALRDAVGDLHPIDVSEPALTSLPGSDLVTIEPLLAARWTVGFLVPADSASVLQLEMLIGGVPVAAWDLTSADAGADVTPTDLPVVEMDDELAWTDVLRVTPTGLGALVCGDPSIESIAHIVAVTFDVENTGHELARWPGVSHPETPAVVQWDDGGGAAFSLETFDGDTEPLVKTSTRFVQIPPGTTQDRALVFAAPRDGRLVSASALPDGVWLDPPAGEPVWLDLADVDPTVGVPPELCDLGFLGAPLPYAFGPGPKFEIRGEVVGRSVAEQNAATIDLLQRVLAGAALYYDANGESFDDLTASRFAAFTPDVELVSHQAGTLISSAVGTVFFDTFEDEEDQLYLITESPSGRWFCAFTDSFSPPDIFDAEDSEETAGLCLPAEEEDDS